MLFEPTRLLTFKKISNLPVFSPTQMEINPPYSLLLEPTPLLNLRKNSSLYPCIRELTIVQIICFYFHILLSDTLDRDPFYLDDKTVK